VAASISLSRAKSSAVKAHLRALGLTGVVLERRNVVLFDMLAEGACPASRRAAPVVVVREASAGLQNCVLGGIVIGGGTLYRFPERELLDAEVAPVAI
jgi:hypothetical protein